MKTFKDASPEQVNEAMSNSWAAYKEYRKKDLKERAGFLRTIAKEMQEVSSKLIATASSETNLSEARLKSELQRTVFQLTSYADACEEGTWLDIRIDTA